MFKNILKIITYFTTVFIFATSNRLCISGNKFLLDEVLINKSKVSEGLLINSRMVQGISDGFEKFPYPDTKKWNVTRNNAEFVSNMESWKLKGLNGFTLGMQGGGPSSTTSGQTHKNSAFNGGGSLKSDYINRLKLVLDESNRLDMIVILSLFYRSQVSIFGSYPNVLKATTNTGNSYKGSGHVPSDKIIQNSQVIFLHGNSMTTESAYSKQLNSVKKSKYYVGQPIVYNEAGTKLFLDWSIKNGVGWGYYDQGKNNYKDGFQSPPVNWGINTSTKQNFFNKIK